MSYGAVVLAAGSGKRMGAGKNKVLLELKGIPIIIRSLQLFLRDKNCSECVVVINQMEQHVFEQLLEQFELKDKVKCIHGGAERQLSVYNGIKGIKEAPYVFIHDGARPFVKRELLQKLYTTVQEKDACLVGVPVKDTVKNVEDGYITETLERSKLWGAQTPQAFQRHLILEAHENAHEENFLGTDDASLVERLHKRVYMVQGDYLNIKLTTPEDMIFGEAILNTTTF